MNDIDSTGKCGGIEVNADPAASSDIWSIRAFGMTDANVSSPLRDLLDYGTLADLLAQDELFQELGDVNPSCTITWGGRTQSWGWWSAS